MKIKTATSGPGAAHIGFSMFGARGPLCGPEDDNGGGAAPPAIATPAPTQAAPVDTGTAPGVTSEKMLPQSQVNDLVARARAEGREAALKQQAAPAPAATGKKPKADEAPALSQDDVRNEIVRERAFTRAIAAAGVSDRQLARMESAFAAEKPSDVAVWCASYLEDMAIAKPVVQQQIAQPAAVAPTVAATPAAAAPNAPVKVDPLTNGGLVDIMRLSEAQLTQLGPKGVREHFEKAVTVGNQLSGAPPRPSIAQRK